MKTKDIKMGQNYYAVNTVESLFFRDFPEKSLLVKFKMTKDIMIIKPKNIFASYIMARMKAIIVLDNFRDKQLKAMDKQK